MLKVILFKWSAFSLPAVPLWAFVQEKLKRITTFESAFHISTIEIFTALFTFDELMACSAFCESVMMTTLPPLMLDADHLVPR